MRDERMRPAGLAAVERAKADGTWGSAYSGQAAIEVPSDLAAALAAHPAAQETFDNLSRANRYAVLYRIETAKRSETRNSASSSSWRCSRAAKPSTLRRARRGRRRKTSAGHRSALNS